MQSAMDETIDQLARKENKKANYYLLNYHEIKKEYLLERTAIIHGGGPCLSDAIPGGGNVTSDPTGRKVQRLGNLEQVEKWLTLIEDVVNRLPLKMWLLLQLRWRHRYTPSKKPGRPGWVDAVQADYPVELSKLTGKKPEDCWVGNRRTFYVWWERILDYVVRLAIRKKIL